MVIVVELKCQMWENGVVYRHLGFFLCLCLCFWFLFLFFFWSFLVEGGGYGRFRLVTLLLRFWWVKWSINSGAWLVNH